MVGSLSSLGLGSGLDLQNILDQLKEADRYPIRRKESSQVEYKDKIEKLDSVQAKLLQGKEDALNLSLQSTYMGRSTSLSDTSVLTANTLEGVETGSYYIKVNSLAQKSSWKADTGLASKDAMVNDTGGDLTFSYSVNGQGTSLNVASGTSLSSLASLINSDENNPGATASVIKDGSGENSYKLLLESDSMGEEGRINITEQLTSYNISEETGSASVLDAEIEVGGVSYQRASNSIDDIISGTTINLQSTGETTLSVVADKQSVKDEIKSFVTNLKDIISEINKHSSYDVEAEEQGALYDVTSIRSFKSQLVNDVMRPYEGSGDITSMVDLGLEYTRDGGITLDEDVLNNAVETNFEAVKEFMLGNSENETEGWADSVNERLRSATSSVDGIVKLERNSAKDTLDRLAKQITNDQQRLDKKYDIMAKQFAQLDSYMNEMNSMSSYLTQHFNALDSSKDN